MTLLRGIVPVGLTFLAVLLAALPWGLPAEIAPALPLIPYVVIHAMIERRPSAVPDWLVFLAGLALDVLGQGPLGYWALVYLVGFVCVRSASEPGPSGTLRGILLLALTLAALVLVQWLITSIYRVHLAAVVPLLGGAAIALAAYAVVVLLFPAGPRETPRSNGQLARGV